MSEPRTVLIVEDEFAIADLLEMVLADEGYRVLTAANGRQGLQRLAEDPRPDLVISDYIMPILDGPERNIPCIVMSSIPEATVQERIGNYAAFVRKPFQLAAMIELVATILAALRPEP